MDDLKNVFDIEEANKKITLEQRRQRLKEIEDVKKILKTPEGRRFFWRLLGKCKIFNSSFTANSNQTAFNEGIRNVGLEILSEINEADVNVFARMQQEYLSALKSKKESKR